MDLKELIAQGIKNSLSYEDYRAEITAMVANQATSGDQQTAALIDYTMLNDRRMKRWDKTIKVPDTVKQKVSAFKGHITWLVLTESWCGDAAHVIPVINKIAELSDHIDLRLVYRDENDALMNAFLTNGSKSIPKVIMIDSKTSEVMGTYGPRPSEATQIVLDYMSENSTITPEFKEELQGWYNSDKGQTAINDLLKLLNL